MSQGEIVYPKIYVEQTLCIIKPDATKYESEIEDAILQRRYTIIQKRRVHLSPEQVSDFYSEKFGELYFQNLVAFMSSDSIVVYLLARENAISHLVKMAGPTNPERAKENDPKSLRAMYGTNEFRNAIHCCSDAHAALKEIKFFFPNVILEPIMNGEEAKDYLKSCVNATLLKGLTQLCKEKPEDPIIWLADWLMENNPNKPFISTSRPIVVEV